VKLRRTQPKPSLRPPITVSEEIAPWIAELQRVIDELNKLNARLARDGVVMKT
jgi:adenylosuccinate lyase